MSNHPVFGAILAGGGGTRFWPVSRKGRPKQLLSFFGTQSLLERTWDRLESLVPAENRLVITTAELAAQVSAVLKDLPANNLLCEPVGRNTAPAIGLAALVASARATTPVLAVVPSDHFIANPTEFSRLAGRACEVAASGPIATLGIVPTRPETGYGYLRMGAELGSDVRELLGFVEKPNAERALRYLLDGGYLWNAGIFFMRADVLLSEVRNQLPELHQGLMALAPTVDTPRFSAALAEIYPELPSISVDYGVMERAAHAVVLPADMGWSDVGSWSVLDELGQSKEDNKVHGSVVAVDSSANILYADEGAVVAAVGVEGLVVAVSQNRVLVCPKGRAQDVRRVVDVLTQDEALSRFL
jgi:mannose-1-phosphate guanylyltransferase